MSGFGHPYSQFHKPWTLGRIYPGGQFRLVSPETNEDVAIGDRGELRVKHHCLCVGYYADPQAYEVGG